MANDQPEQRTRGGWIPVGTSAERRATAAKGETRRGRESRRRLLDAARATFEDIGYFDATVDDIVTRAGMARGSFYTYFTSKLEIFREVGREVDEAIHQSVSTQPGDIRRDVISNLERSHRRYVAAYREHAKMYGLLEQVATMDPDMSAGRLESRTRHVERVTASIRRWQAKGLADPDINASVAAGALVAMVSNFTYWRLVRGEDYDEEQSADMMTEIWNRTLQLRAEPNPDWLDGGDPGRPRATGDSSPRDNR